MSEIKLKVGQTVRFRNGMQGVVIDDIHDTSYYKFKIQRLNKNVVFAYTGDGHHFYTKEKTQWDVVEILEKPEDEDVENKIKLKVGQKVKFRDGVIGKVVAFKEDFGRLFGTPYQASYKDKEMNILYCYNDKGELKTDGSKSELDIVEILEEPKEKDMEENLKEKYEKLINRRFKNEDGDVVTITSVDIENDSVLIKFNDEVQEYSATFKEIDEMLEKSEEPDPNPLPWEGRELEEVKGKYELSVTVNDVNNSCKNDKYYFDNVLDLPLNLRGLEADNFNLYQLLTNTEALSCKNDTFRFSKIIKLNDKELGKITIRVTQLED